MPVRATKKSFSISHISPHFEKLPLTTCPMLHHITIYMYIYIYTLSLQWTDSKSHLFVPTKSTVEVPRVPERFATAFPHPFLVHGHHCKNGLIAGEVKHDTVRFAGLLGCFFTVFRSICRIQHDVHGLILSWKGPQVTGKKHILQQRYYSIPNYPPPNKKTSQNFIHNHPRPKSKAPQEISCFSCQGTVLISVMRETPASMAPRRILKPSVKASESSMDPWIHGAANPSGWQGGKSSHLWDTLSKMDTVVFLLMMWCILFHTYVYNKKIQHEHLSGGVSWCIQ